jgi:hypothetical protein
LVEVTDWMRLAWLLAPMTRRSSWQRITTTRMTDSVARAASVHELTFGNRRTGAKHHGKNRARTPRRKETLHPDEMPASPPPAKDEHLVLKVVDYF